MTKRRRRFLFIAGACLLAGSLIWLRPRPGPHLLLITLDTTRADRLGTYGYSGARTPVLDSLAASGIVWESAYTVAPVTLPAHASLLTGLYPAEHGVHTNGHGRLGAGIRTLAEVLKRQGYDTAAFVGALVLDGKFGLDRGFDVYDDDFSGDEPTVDLFHRSRQGQAVVDAALTWLAGERAQPFFCWVHLYDPHAPYLAHIDLFGDEFQDRPYDAEIAYCDQQIGRLVEFLKGHELESRTLIVVVGDHGESLGEHSERTHGSTLYNSTMRVPLIFRQQTRIASGRRVAEQVSLVDVAPTILDLLGAGASWKTTGKSRIREFAGCPAEPRSCYGATDEPFLMNGWSPLRSLVEGRWKYIRTTRAELYDIASDPAELHDLSASQPEQVRAMALRLTEFETQLIARAAVEVKLSSAERRALTSLGYAGGTGPISADSSPTGLPDVKDMLPFDRLAEEAVDLIASGAIDAGIQQLEEITLRAPSYTTAKLYLGNALRKKNDLDKAESVFRSLVESRSDARDGHYGLGLVFLDQGRTDDARSEFLKTLEADPEFGEAHHTLAVVFMQIGRADEALRHLDALLAIDGRHAAGFQLRAFLLANYGRIDEAIADYHRALVLAPDSAGAHHNLGVLLADHGPVAEARRHLTQAVELNPQRAELFYALGALLVREGEYEEAIQRLTQALNLNPGYAAAQERLDEARQALKHKDARRP